MKTYEFKDRLRDVTITEMSRVLIMRMKDWAVVSVSMFYSPIEEKWITHIKYYE